MATVWRAFNTSYLVAGLTFWLLSPAARPAPPEVAPCAEPIIPACDTARVQVANAQAEVQAAAERRALWTTAANALREAQAAFTRGDYAAASRAAQLAIDQARLGIAQTQYPLFPPPNP